MLQTPISILYTIRSTWLKVQLTLVLSFPDSFVWPSFSSATHTCVSINLKSFMLVFFPVWFQFLGKAWGRWSFRSDPWSADYLEKKTKTDCHVHHAQFWSNWLLAWAINPKNSTRFCNHVNSDVIPCFQRACYDPHSPAQHSHFDRFRWNVTRKLWNHSLSKNL